MHPEGEPEAPMKQVEEIEADWEKISGTGSPKAAAHSDAGSGSEDSSETGEQADRLMLEAELQTPPPTAPAAQQEQHSDATSQTLDNNDQPGSPITFIQDVTNWFSSLRFPRLRRRLSSRLIFIICLILGLEVVFFNMWLVHKMDKKAYKSSNLPHLHKGTLIDLKRRCGKHNKACKAPPMDMLELACSSYSGDDSDAPDFCSQFRAAIDANTKVSKKHHHDKKHHRSQSSLEDRIQRLELESIKTHQRLAAIESSIRNIEEELFSSRQNSRNAALNLETALEDVSTGVLQLTERLDGLEGALVATSDGQCPQLPTLSTALLPTLEGIVAEVVASGNKKKSFKTLEKVIKHATGDIKDAKKLDAKVQDVQEEIKVLKERLASHIQETEADFATSGVVFDAMQHRMEAAL